MTGTRFLFKTTKNLFGQTIKLRHKGLWLSKGDQAAITRQIARARGLLSASIASISLGFNADARRFATTYFLTGNTGPDGAEQTQIKKILQLTYHGLSNDFTMKLGGDGDFGFVTRSRSDAADAAISPHDGLGWSRDGHAMHISKKRMLRDADIGVITIIHEGSHKFADTWDHGNSGYREEDDSGWWEPGLTRAQALVNADSYAYFAFRLGATCGM